jgi:hypothetical protein
MEMTMPETTDPLRAALAQAIADKATAESALEQHREAIARAAKLARDAETRLAAATAELETARGQRVHALAHAAAGGGATSKISMREVRDAALDAQDETDAARAAVDVLRTELAGLEDAVRDAGNLVVAARNAVIAPIAAAVLQQMREAETTLIANNAVLMTLLSGGDSGDRDDWSGRLMRNKPLVELRDEFQAFQRRGDKVGNDDDRKHARELAAQWDAAVKSLEADPFAALPQV